MTPWDLSPKYIRWKYRRSLLNQRFKRWVLTMPNGGYVLGALAVYSFVRQVTSPPRWNPGPPQVWARTGLALSEMLQPGESVVITHLPVDRRGRPVKVRGKAR